MSKLNEHLVPLKIALQTAKQDLSPREWDVLQEVLIIALRGKRGKVAQ